MKILYIFLVFILVVSCKEQKHEGKFSKVLVLDKGNNSFTIQNKNNHSVSFNLKINDLFPLDSASIIREIIRKQQRSGGSLSMTAWKFVNSQTYHANPLTNEAWQHEPLIFLNSIGGGFCDDRAAVLAKIWNYLGLSSRVIGLEGHVVPEVFVNNKWQMMDPDLKVVYLNSDSLVYSVNEIAKLGIEVIPNKSNSLFNPIFNHKNPLSKQFINYYTSKEDNIDQTNWHFNYNSINNKFILPSNSQLKMVIDNQTQKIVFQVILSKNTQGVLKIPLVPYSANGSFVFSTNDETYRTSGNYFFPTNKLINSIKIDKVSRDGVINYVVNPKLFLWNEKDITVSIKANHSLFLLQEKLDVDKLNNVLFDQFGFNMEAKLSEQIEFLDYISKIENPRFNRLKLIQLYEKFLFYQKLNSIEFDKQLKKFILKLDDVLLMNNGIYQELEDNHPLHLVKFFIIVYNDISFPIYGK